jgi:hypothetical protein
MATATAIHIGLNNVDPAAYSGWDGALGACENDATAMEQLARDLGYTTHTFLSSQATAGAVFGAISDAAASLHNGDICLITYAGHGGQFPDLSGDEEDRLDETWVLYDREILDDEIRVALSGFEPGVRVVVLSDSCHSGTAVRRMYNQVLDDAPTVRGAYERVAPWLRTRSRVASNTFHLRGVPAEVQTQVLAAHRALYEGIRARTPKTEEISVRASVILISGCQDNQESAEQNGHGVFTASLLQHWSPTFTGDYRALQEAIRRDLPPTQSPNYFTEGNSWPAFERQVPFTVDPPDAAPEDAGSEQQPSDSPPPVEIVLTNSDVVVVKFRDRQGQPRAR